MADDAREGLDGGRVPLGRGRGRAIGAPVHPLLAFLLGLISATGFAPLGLWWLTLIALAGLLWLLGRAGSLRQAALYGWLFGLGQFLLGLNWIATAFTYQAAMPAWLGWIAVVLLSLYLAIYPALAAAIAWRWGRGDRLRLVLLLAGGWMVAEWLRGLIFTGFPWNPLGVAWLPVTPVAGSAAWIGTLGLDGLMVLAAGALALIAARRFIAAALAMAPVALAAVGGWLALPPAGQATAQRITIVQPNIEQQDKWIEALMRANRLRHMALSGRPGTATAPRLLFWPEAAIAEFIEEEPAVRLELTRVLGPRDLLLAGGVAMIRDERGYATSATNSLFVMDSLGRLRARYDKAHLVPYGEYLPMRPLLSLLGLSRLAPGDLDFESGPGPRTLHLPDMPAVGVQICYEIIFSGHVVAEADRPAFLFNPSNDAWFGRFGPPQHLAQARLRAIEEGLPVIRATPTGISAVIDAGGRIVASLPWRTAGTIESHLPQAGSPTLFSRWGNAVPLTLAVLAIVLAIAPRRKSRYAI